MGCTRCQLAKTRHSVVLYRGYIPCDVLFVGEGPGQSEDARGFPFIGDAGRLLDMLVLDAMTAAGCYAAVPHPPLAELFKGAPNGILRVGITNIVACIPLTPNECSSGELRPPNKQEATACQPRLLEIINVSKPRLIVTLGDVAKRFIAVPYEVPSLALIHPAAILRCEKPQMQVLMQKRFIITLADVLKGLTDAK